jgi:hypothetical protein
MCEILSVELQFVHLLLILENLLMSMYYLINSFNV